MPTDAIINVNGEQVQTLEILFLTTLLALLPTLIVMTTSFTRYIISLSFLRTAMGTAQAPPNMVLTGMALILTLFTMAPTISEIEETAYDPYVNELISQEEFIKRAEIPLKNFMITYAEFTSVSMFCELAGIPIPETTEEVFDLPLRVVLPSFVTSELKRAFEIGFFVYIPFMLVDAVVASTLMSMGMIMLPPAMISSPFKLLLFLTIDGWNLMFSTLIMSYG